MDRKLKHLEFIQSTINRLSTNSFLLKGWSVVIVSAFFALSAKDSNPKFAILALVPAISFWALDGYFLSVERSYRDLFDEVRKIGDPDEIDFSMKFSAIHGDVSDWVKATFSKTLLVFHAPILASVFLVYRTFSPEYCFP